jgi:DNA-binding MarR family transcriptional regulator
MASTVRPSRRRSPHAEELRVWRDFIETSERLRAALEARLQMDSGLSSGDYAVLLGLSEAAGNRMRSSTLAEQIHWERSRLSHHLARMEVRGLLSREKCQTDNRGADVVLTSAGASKFRRASGPHLHAIQETFIDALTPDLLDSVDTITGALKRQLDALERPA